MMNETKEARSETDRIEKKILLRASRQRVWRALSDSTEFGSWFGMKIEGPFASGKTVKAAIAPTKVDPEVAAKQKEFEGMPFTLVVDRVEPERVLSFRWHPFAIERDKDYSAEPMTLVTFELADAPEGILLTVTESGFDRIPIERRAKAFAANEGGWGMVIKLIEKHLAQASA